VLRLYSGAADTLNGSLVGDGVLNITGAIVVINSANPGLIATTNIAANAAATMGSTQSLGSGYINLTDATSILNVANTSSGTIANPITGIGTLRLNGSGTTTIARTNTGFSGAADVNGPVIAADTAALGTGAINISATGALTYAVSGTIANPITGSGPLNLAASTGVTTLTGNNTISNINALPGSTIVAASANALGDGRLTMTDATVILAQNTSLGNVVINGASTLTFAPAIAGGGRAGIQNLSATGAAATLVFNTNIAAGTSDRLSISYAPSGTFNLAINNTGGAPDPTVNIIPLTLIDAPAYGGGSATYLLTTSTINFGGMNLYSLNILPGAGAILQVERTNKLTTTGAHIAGAAGALPLSWLTELTTVEQRMGDLHADTRQKSGIETWARAYAQRYNVNANPTGVPFHEDQYGADAGFDFKGETSGNLSAYFGAFLGYGIAKRDIDSRDDSNASTDSVYGGVYLTLLTADDWYVDFVAKANRFKNTINTSTITSLPLGASYNTTSVGGSIEAGKRFTAAENWFIEPQVQASYLNITGADYMTDTNMFITVRPMTTSQVRMGVLASRKIRTKTGYLAPYAQLHGVHQWANGGEILAQGSTYATKIDGNRIEAGFGVNWLIKPGVQAYFDYEYTKAADYTKPYGLTAGVRFAW